MEGNNTEERRKLVSSQYVSSPVFDSRGGTGTSSLPISSHLIYHNDHLHSESQVHFLNSKTTDGSPSQDTKNLNQRSSWIVKNIRRLSMSIRNNSTIDALDPDQLDPDSAQIIPPQMFGKPLVSHSIWQSLSLRFKPRNSSGGQKTNTQTIPLAISTAIWRLEGCLATEGLFRVNGNRTNIAHLRETWEAGADLHTLKQSLTQETAHNVAGFLTHYLYQLPEPVIPIRMYFSFLKLGEDLPPRAQINRARKLLRKLPVEHRDVLRALIVLLSQVADHAGMNKMNSENLGVVFGPILMQPGKEIRDKRIFYLQNSAIEFLIKKCPDIFKRRIESYEDHIVPQTVSVFCLNDNSVF